MLLVGTVGSPAEVRPLAGRSVGVCFGDCFHPDLARSSPVPHTSPVPRSAPDGGDGDAYFFTRNVAKSKAPKAIPKTQHHATGRREVLCELGNHYDARGAMRSLCGRGETGEG